MDPLTAFLIATLMMLLNGGVLGLMHRDLPAELRPSAFSWRLGTLLIAAGCILLVVQAGLPTAVGLPLANASLMLGLTCYWRALRQFYGLPDRWLMLLPTALGTAAMVWFVVAEAGLVARVLCMSVVWIVLLLASVRVLHARPADDVAISRRVMMFVLLGMVAFMAVRAGYFAFFMDRGGTILDPRHWINLITPMIAAVLPVIGTTAFLLMCSQRIRRQWELAASTDYLTGLANRRTLASHSQRLLEARGLASKGLAIGIVDIDHFKSINDRHGHEVGDQALRFVAKSIRTACRAGDLAARQGGEEFVVLFSDVDAKHALDAAERIREAVAQQPFEHGGTPLPITVSIGLTLFASSEHALDDGLRRADAALYQSKSAGRNRTTLLLA